MSRRIEVLDVLMSYAVTAMIVAWLMYWLRHFTRGPLELIMHRAYRAPVSHSAG